MEIKNPISLADLAREVKVSKSTLHYYLSFGLIETVGTIGKMFVFNKNTTTKRLNEIKRLRKDKGLTLKEVKNELK